VLFLVVLGAVLTVYLLTDEACGCGGPKPVQTAARNSVVLVQMAARRSEERAEQLVAVKRRHL
jgi:hypothetical protein